MKYQKPDAALDPNPRTDCPWEESGLVNWEEPSTWGGALPDPSEYVTLPENTKVRVSSLSFDEQVWSKITVPATSELIFADAEIHLRVSNLVVDGKLRIGSPVSNIIPL